MRRTSLLIVVAVALVLGITLVYAEVSTDRASTAQTGAAVFVSDLAWSSVKNGLGPVERDRSNGGGKAGDGGPIKLDGKIYAKGLGTHPLAEITYALGRRYTRFQAALGIDDLCGGAGSVEFRVMLDGTTAYTKRVTGATPAQIVSIPTTNVDTMRLVVTDGGDGFNCDHADWADARLTGGTGPPASTVAPTTVAPTTTPPTTVAPTTTTVSPPGDPVLVGAGDIAVCSSNKDEATAKVLDGIPGTVFTVGDNAYPNGTAANYRDCYAPSWGRHRGRTRPSAGNHEYRSGSAAGYFGYFGAAAGPPATGYYSYDLGTWHVVVVNSNCAKVGGCGAGSPQEQWIRQDLAATAQPCTVAYWHHPLFTSGSDHGSSVEMRPIFQALYDAGAEVVVVGHNHQYERFAPQDPNGARDDVRGIRQFVAGMGGGGLDGFEGAQPNSEVRNGGTHGVLSLTLGANGYAWQFVPVAGKTFTDAGIGACH